MKKIKNLLSLLLVFVSILLLASCGNDAPESTRVTIDVNPSFELIVDEDKKVVSVTALNDDASVLLYGEALVGKTAEEATEIIVNLTVKAGYIDSETEQKVSISVSGDTKFQEKLEKEIAEKAEKVFEESGVKAVVEKHQALAIEKLREMVLENSTYTEEEVAAMSEEELINALKASRIETALLVSEEMRKVYYEAKAYEISFAEREETAKVIEGLGTIYQTVASLYSTALDVYREAINNVEQAKYDLLIANDSLYQQAVQKVLAAKTAYLEQKKVVAKLEAGDLKVEAVIELERLEEVYDTLLKALDDAAAYATSQFDSLINIMKQAEETFTSIEAMFTSNIKETLQQKAVEIEAKLNETKNNFFADFEEAHKDDINAYLESLRQQKEALMA